VATVFADTGYWIALMRSSDELHERATAAAATLGSTHVVTTQMVLAEALNDTSRLGESRREFAVEMVRQIRDDPSVEIVSQTDEQFWGALERYASRSDQTWSLTDCASFLVMEALGITDALAFDQDFQQAGFVALLRGEQDS